MNGKTIKIVTHCWAEKLPQYAAMLSYQLSSLILYAPPDQTSITVCFAESDKATKKTIQWFLSNCDHEMLSIYVMPMTSLELGRRAIGRNIVAQSTDADLVWFTDVDYVFGEGCIQSVLDQDFPTDASIVYPRTIGIQKTYILGDCYWQKVLDNPQIIDINKDDFGRHTHNRAIGGVQIIKGDCARKYGYLPLTKWQVPCEPGQEFKNFMDDTSFRRRCEKRGKMLPITVSNVYRLRHTKTSYENKPIMT